MKLHAEVTQRIETVEQKLWRIEKLVWYLVAMITLKAGIDITPFVSALFSG